ncbi:Uncharacterised protein [Vibrio cholerae]|nr:Uncharacterised protein [Vibrio cholerae]CSI44500.1 Uncharacterised protein [Vibrio cholerae]
MFECSQCSSRPAFSLFSDPALLIALYSSSQSLGHDRCVPG